MHQKGDAELAGGVPRKSLLDGDEVFERLGHLLARDVEMADVEEVVDPLLAGVVCLDVSHGQGACIPQTGQVRCRDGGTQDLRRPSGYPCSRLESHYQ